MANDPQYPDAIIEAEVNTVTADLDSGFLEIYEGTAPVDANTALSGDTLLVTLDLSATAFSAAAASGSAGSRVVTADANTISTAAGVATGTASFYRFYESDGTTVVAQGSVGTSGADLNLSSTSIVLGQDVDVTDFSFTMPEN